MTTTPPDGPPVPVRVALPDGQELTARLWVRRQTPRGWAVNVLDEWVTERPRVPRSPGAGGGVRTAAGRSGWHMVSSRRRPVVSHPYGA
ncbi:hypothetical protein ACWCPX_39705 [Streptomyces olivaceoviridis]